ncbi:hypothetical protein MZ018_15240 [Shewanella sp. JNE10-2]|uniref:hypothetical protein n=1 Tax=unclassified Shewanella TaxID=196818 RepID=UPI0020055F73|nr:MULTISPECIES: hypothetical protein [unclassified Shewanella]MCK7632097.1 hypothetical protein [Shewanella sp. JNE9-1]MCK7647249.1 hypothetical protein [Shewanella sp. JNE3-1]MCK7655395.1 hypothetical protein [Shewanella sp. JNE4-1]UPO26255.1 hypothetical protein MZ018_15240 [Shewanella sp. JNE10-2]UPO37239.1 hypothetical protein MZ097_10180 [Shewanella sp. JNE7]
MLLLITEKVGKLEGIENAIVRSPAELCCIQPQGPALVIIDIKLPNAAVLEWASKRTRATLWWLASTNLPHDSVLEHIPAQHCSVQQTHMDASEFIRLLLPHYFGRLFDDTPDCILSITPGELEQKLIRCRELVLIPEHEVLPTQAIWAYLYWFTSSTLDMSIEEYEQRGVKLKHDLGAEQMCCLISNLPFSSFVMLLK